MRPVDVRSLKNQSKFVDRGAPRKIIGDACRIVAICLIFGVLLTSCAVLREDEPHLGVSVDRHQLASVAKWRMEGRLGVRNSDGSWHASLAWDHQEDIDLLYLSGPFGQGALNIKLTERYMRIVSADGAVEESENPEQLLDSILGIDVPVRALRYWLLGLAYPAARFDSEVDRAGRLKKLTQLGWTTEYKSYETVPPWVVPAKLSVTRDGSKLKLVVDDWQFSDRSK